jgi:hypothetical protein
MIVHHLPRIDTMKTCIECTGLITMVAFIVSFCFIVSNFKDLARSLAPLLMILSAMMIPGVLYTTAILSSKVEDWYRSIGPFTGRIIVQHHEYIVSNESSYHLSHILDMPAATIAKWPCWHTTSSIGLDVYSMTEDDATPPHIEAIAKDCLNIVVNPHDHRRDHIMPAGDLFWKSTAIMTLIIMMALQAPKNPLER